jgi:hypothetical protein
MIAKIHQKNKFIDTEGVNSLDKYEVGGLPLRVYQRPSTAQEIAQEAQLLELNGIDLEQKKRSFKKHYRLFICQFDCLEIYQRGVARENQPLIQFRENQKVNWIKVNSNLLTREIMKIKKLAVRTLYILGYDIGIVDVIVAYSGPRYRITRIAPLKQASKDFLAAINKRISVVHQRKNEIQDAMLGADIEFVLRHQNGKYVIASNHFSRHGKVGHDAIWLKGHRNKYPLAEFRPTPSENPRSVYNNLIKCMKIAIKKLNYSKIEWLAGGYPIPGYPIGGHIHFSKIKLDSFMIRALDNYLTLPLLLLESEKSMERRPKYGYIGDYREQFHGGFEYRTPPSWITSPVIAKGVLAIAKVISTSYRQLTWMPLHLYEVQKAFYMGDKQSIYPIVQAVWSELKKCPTYPSYQEELDSFYSLIEQGHSWNEYDDIREAWKLPPYHTSPKS